MDRPVVCADRRGGLEIVRPPDAIVEGKDGESCSVGGQPGRYYVLWPDGRGDCVTYSDMCGGPGLTPPSWELQGPDESACMDCCTLGRSMVEVCDFCRARDPGWTWQCSADNERLECRPPPAGAPTSSAAIDAD